MAGFLFIKASKGAQPSFRDALSKCILLMKHATDTEIKADSSQHLTLMISGYKLMLTGQLPIKKDRCIVKAGDYHTFILFRCSVSTTFIQNDVT